MKEYLGVWACAIGASICLTQVGCRVPTHNPGIPIKFYVVDLADTWFGFTEDATTYYRLVLQTNRTGLLLIELADGSVQAEHIEKWRIDKDEVHCIFKANQGSSDAVTLDCGIRANQLIGVLRGRGGWHQGIFLRRWGRIQETFSRLSSGTSIRPH
jgi:hypothetical protein